MREISVVQEQGVWMVKVVDGDRTQRFTCASEAQAQALSKVMGKPEEPPKKRAS